jgi:hypothetical protein
MEDCATTKQNVNDLDRLFSPNGGIYLPDHKVHLLVAAQMPINEITERIISPPKSPSAQQKSLKRIRVSIEGRPVALDEVSSAQWRLERWLGQQLARYSILSSTLDALSGWE